MSYVLENIEQQVEAILKAVASVKFNEAEVRKILSEIHLERDKIGLAFNHQILSGEEDGSIGRFFLFHQRSLTRILNRIPESSKPKQQVVLQNVRESVAGLITEIECDFPEYFDQECSLPHFHYPQLICEISDAIQSLRSKYEPTALDKDLIEIAIAPFQLAIADLEYLSHRKLHYIRMLKKSLLTLDTTMNEPDLLRQDVCRVLLQNNFNSEIFFQYYVERVQRSLSTCETLSDKIDQLSYYYKICSQVHTLQTSFESGKQPISVQLVEWIGQELEYHRYKQQLQSSQPTKADGVSNDFKLNFDLSVSHLAYLFKSFIETGVVQNKNTSELIRFLTKFVKTKKSESVSYESFRIKFYNPETGTKDAVKKTLQSLLNYMNKN